jgi:hypothetical protein
MWEYIKQCWVYVVTIAGALVTITGILAFDARYAKTDDMDKVTINIASAAEQIKAVKIEQNMMKLELINKQMLQTRLLMKTYPNDRELKQDYRTLEQEKNTVQEEIKKSVK